MLGTVSGQVWQEKRAHKGACDKNQLNRVERTWALCTKDVGWHPTLSLCQGLGVLPSIHVLLFLPGLRLDSISQPSLQ